MRRTININDNWLFKKGEDDELNINIPHTWNAIDGQDGGNDYYRGTCLYKKSLNKPSIDIGDRVYLEFEGVAMSATVLINECEVGKHAGGYSTFRVDLTDKLQEENIITVMVNNEDSTTIYPQKADFTFYGGIYRNVKLVIVPQKHFVLDYYGGTGVKVTPEVNLDDNFALVTVEAWVSNCTEKVNFKLEDHEICAEALDGYATATFNLPNVRLWNGVVDPYLYELRAEIEDGDSVVTKFGCRHFDIDPQEGFILNGKPYLLRGVSKHQDFKDVGNALGLEHFNLDMELIREIGATTIRLAHYQHAQDFYDLCDQYGLIVWAEIPYITMHMDDGFDNTVSQMTELVIQNYNHPSIVTWGLSNEITAASVMNEELYNNHKVLNDLCHKLDKTRPTVLANVFMLDIEDKMLDIPDINSYNLYFGWYLGELEENDEFFDEFHERFPNRAIGFSEYGADANPKYHSSDPERGDYTESYQSIYHEHILNMINERPWLWATHVWNMFDFGADGRIEGGKPGENQKGLVTFDRKLKKDAFYLYKAAWNTQEKFVHLTGKRYVYRNETETEIKVYSNLNKVTLLVDGDIFAEQVGETVFKFNVPISSKHKIEVCSGEYYDESIVEYVSEPYKEYIYKEKVKLSNWFDSDEVDSQYYSIFDTINDIRTNEKAGAIIDEMMKSGADTHGDVAAAVQDNPALQKMLGKMQLIRMLTQGGAAEENIKQINRVLQTIKK